MGIGFNGQPLSVRQVVDAARRAEALGFESIWLAEDLWTRRNGLVYLSCVAMETTTAFIGTSVINPYSYHPFQIATLLNTLSDVAPARLRLGIGSGADWWRPLFAAEMDRIPPRRALREAVKTVRRLMRGESVEIGGEIFSLRVDRACYTSGVPPWTGAVPIYVGAKGVKTLELAGEIADGVLIAAWTRPDQMPPILDAIARGARRAGRKVDDLDIVGIVATSVADSGPIDGNTLSRIADRVARLGPSDIDALGFDEKQVGWIRAALASSDCEAALAAVSPKMAATWAAAGTTDTCVAHIEALKASGVNMPMLVPFGGNIDALLELGVRLIGGAPTDP